MKLLKAIDVAPDKTENAIGKRLWLAIIHNVTIEGDREIKREVEIVEYSPEDRKPSAPSLFEQYDIAAI